jgi:hypothetical protein
MARAIATMGERQGWRDRMSGVERCDVCHAPRSPMRLWQHVVERDNDFHYVVTCKSHYCMSSAVRAVTYADLQEQARAA